MQLTLCFICENSRTLMHNHQPRKLFVSFSIRASFRILHVLSNTSTPALVVFLSSGENQVYKHPTNI